MGEEINLYLIIFCNVHILGKIVMSLGLFKTYQNKEKLSEIINGFTSRINDLGKIRDV